MRRSEPGRGDLSITHHSFLLILSKRTKDFPRAEKESISFSIPINGKVIDSCSLQLSPSVSLTPSPGEPSFEDSIFYFLECYTPTRVAVGRRDKRLRSSQLWSEYPEFIHPWDSPLQWSQTPTDFFGFNSHSTISASPPWCVVVRLG